MTTKKNDVIAIAIEDMIDHGYKHGPCIECRQIGSEDSTSWEIEFAYEGEVRRSKTTDPPSIALRVNSSTKEVSSVDLM